MKKIVLMMLVLASMSVKVNAQWFLGGSAGLGYFSERFQMDVRPFAGYEINDRWAVGLGVGLGIQESEAFGVFNYCCPLKLK